MEVYLIRHGQSTNNALMDDQHLRDYDPSLSDVGHRQAERVADFLKAHANLEELVHHKVDQRDHTERHQFTHLYCSPMHRALQTARPISEVLGLTSEVWINIHEIGGMFLEHEDGSVTGFGGMTRPQITAQFPRYILPETITDAGWYDPARGREHYADMIGRVVRVARELHERADQEATKNDKVILVTHGAFLNSLLKAFLHTLPNDNYYFWHYNTAITRVDILERGTVSIRYVNRVTHLPAELVT